MIWPEWMNLHTAWGGEAPTPWGHGAYWVGSRPEPCSHCGKKSRKKDGKHLLSGFGADGEGGEFMLCSECQSALWAEHSAGLWSEPELPFTGSLL